MAGTIDLTVSEPNQVQTITIQVPGTPGSPGTPGPTGAPGPANVLTIGTTTTGAPGSNAAATITGVSPNQTLNLTIPQGPTGATGPANTLSIGTVTTVDAVTGGSATITGTAPNQVLNLTLPRGYGVVPGGAQYDVLLKNSGTDYDTGWYKTDVANTPNTVMVRDANARSAVADPAGPNDIATKNYTDNGDSSTLTSAKSYADTGDSNTLASAKTYTNGMTWPSSAITDATSSSTANTIAKRDASGNVNFNQIYVTGLQDNNAAALTRKDYVDGLGVSAPTASALVKRDANGRAQVVDPSAAQDIATKNYVDSHTPTGVTAPTANTLMQRDANGRSQVADPAVAADIATKNYVDSHTPTGVTTATANSLMQRDANGRSSVADPAVSTDIATKNYVDLHGNVLFLNATDPVPAGTAANTLIYRPNTVKTSSFFWGSGTAFPTSSALAASDTYFRTDLGTNGSLWVYTGSSSSGSNGWVHKGVLVCTSTTRPSVTYAGLQIHETDSSLEVYHNGSSWTYIGVQSWVNDTVNTSYNSALSTTANTVLPGMNFSAAVPKGRTLEAHFSATQLNFASAGTAVIQLYINGSLVDSGFYQFSGVNTPISLMGAWQNTTGADTAGTTFQVQGWVTSGGATLYASSYGAVRFRHRIS